ncbi:MAG: restriction endonuclease subunit S [Flavobacteriales bacterium]|jgi:type I restriction enzyme S subunit|nr:restriction endonuclease subunit S [Flavobacteriales bacterium]
MMKKYESYKDSGTLWLGKVPEHWESHRIDWISKIVRGNTGFKKDELLDNGDYVALQYGKTYKVDIVDDKFNYYVNEEFYKQSQVVSRGDTILISTSETIEDLGHTCYYDKEQTGLIGGEQILLKPNEDSLNGKYLYRYAQCFSVESKKYAKGLKVFRFNTNDLKNIFLAIPPIEEQTKIANYLDYKTTQLDNLINKKEKLIELLKEERTAMISQAVTKGLDKSAPKKDSGIEWLGEIPEHWSLIRMRYLCDIGTGDKDTENREEDGAYPFFVRSQTVERISTYTFDGEAILTAGDGVGVCKVWHYIDGKFDYHQRVYRMSDFTDVMGKYMFYYLKYNFVKEVKKLSAKSTVDSLRRPMFQNFRIAFGSIEEQRKIVNHIEKQEIRIDTLISRYEKEIELIKEYKASLITEVVTGKVDVRNESLN